MPDFDHQEAAVLQNCDPLTQQRYPDLLTCIQSLFDFDVKVCFYTDCGKIGSMRCSRCKSSCYCSAEHQRAHWKMHKKDCKPPLIKEEEGIKVSERPVESSSRRNCRCMFCGEAQDLGSEEEAIEHMRVCVALQEQLASKEQFTVPSILRDKMKMDKEP